MVEDEEMLRLAIAKMLRKEGFTVIEAADGSEALRLAETHGPQLTAMLLDVTLPGIASPEILREVRRLRPDLRVILTSAYSEQKVAATFAEIALPQFLRKPYRFTDILKLLS